MFGIFKLTQSRQMTKHSFFPSVTTTAVNPSPCDTDSSVFKENAYNVYIKIEYDQMFKEL